MLAAYLSVHTVEYENKSKCFGPYIAVCKSRPPVCGRVGNITPHHVTRRG